MSRNRFIVRLGRWDGVEERDARKPQLSVSIVLKSKALLPGRGGEEKAELKDSSESDLLRLMSILTKGKG